jgi:hypothetical protein
VCGCVGVRHVRLGARCVTELVVCWLDTIAHWGVVGPGSSRELSEAQKAKATLDEQVCRDPFGGVSARCRSLACWS